MPQKAKDKTMIIRVDIDKYNEFKNELFKNENVTNNRIKICKVDIINLALEIGIKSLKIKNQKENK